MPRQATAISILLASPFDVVPERDLISRLVADWNNLRGRNRGIFLDLLKFETSVSAGFGDDGQAVVNDSIGDDYDAVIGIFWNRIGTPTGRSTSGTIEEIERAIARYRDGENVEIAVYFKKAPVLSDDIDLDQIQGVRNFKIRLESEGGLHKPFTDETTLRYEIEILLDKLAKRFGVAQPVSVVSQSVSVGNQQTPQHSINQTVTHLEEVGYLDAIENIEKYSNLAFEFVTQLGSELEKLAATTSVQATSISEISSLGPIQAHEMKPVITVVAKAMDKFSDFVEPRESEFRKSSLELANNARSLIDLMYDFEPSDSDVNGLITLLETLVESSSSSLESLKDLYTTTRGLQRMTTVFNHSRKRILKNFDAVISDIGNMRDVLAVAVSELSARHISNMKLAGSRAVELGGPEDD
jgi:hypothetical protein